MATVGPQPRRREDGFGLLEVMLSLTVLLMVLIASSYLVDNVVSQAAFNRQRVAAAELAEQYLETTSNATLSSLQADISKDVLLTATPVTVGGINYSVWSHLEWAGTGSAPSLCSSGNPPQVVRATMTVKWGNNQSMGETSVINPPYGTVIPGDGFLSIQILGAGAPSPPADTASLINVPVTVTPVTTLSTALTSGTRYPTSGSTYSLSVGGLTQAVSAGDTLTIGSGSQTQNVTVNAAHAVGTGTQLITVNSFTASSSFALNTPISDTAAWGSATVYNPDQNGCVYLQEAVGKYSVSLASPSGGPSFIDYQEYATPGVTGQNPQVATVATAGLAATSIQFHYDEAGTVTLTPSAGAPIASGMPISVGNTSLQPSATAVIVPHGSAATSATLFPYTTGYSVWYGDCTTQGAPEYPAGATTFSFAPQGSAAATITGLSTLTMAVTQTGAGAQAPKATATVADPNAATDGCTNSNGEVYTLTGISGSGTAYTVSTAILPQTYTIVVTDPNNSQTTSLTAVVSATGVMVGATNYPTGTPIPVTVP
jgi:hypothetical protein